MNEHVKRHLMTGFGLLVSVIALMVVVAVVFAPAKPTQVVETSTRRVEVDTKTIPTPPQPATPAAPAKTPEGLKSEPAVKSGKFEAAKRQAAVAGETFKGWWDNLTTSLQGSCTLREKEIELTEKWEELTVGGPHECIVVYEFVPGTKIMAHDGRGEFELNTGVIDRNPRLVRLISGNRFFKFSLCPKNLSGKLLDWECRERQEPRGSFARN